MSTPSSPLAGHMGDFEDAPSRRQESAALAAQQLQQPLLTPEGRTLLEERASLLRDHTIPALRAGVVDGHPQDWSPQPDLNREVFKRGMFYGGVMGSFACEMFGTERLQKLTRGEIDARFQLFRELSHLG